MSGEQKNILIIDDSASIRKFIRMLLEESNYKVYEASNGEEGIEVFKKNSNIDLIITDIYMPKKTGIEVLIELEKGYKGIKIIVLSDGGKENFNNELGICESLGAMYFMKKDDVKQKLLPLINEVLLENK
ncbi:two-component system chemotaxis response regulator CheY [Clostridium tetanomorphum]|uniref:Stage 0 sporulation protein A homolog n=1 Tax=Clostridium tetanomorphum TaxID=1553 RepID=A0A923J2H0_CLOTT|nr:response regulator [Clostridium tetanomorphum]KAJ52983.1 response regulator [Clostridium tetanomorphum DSM 665]MBC2398513.1 response regulator [Clostridium tetanomorphum]MBP1864923.1 two-component system chemotaxis response regulator CheY [Clostridium tetanomorphum]NRS83129.1 two-component system chemotaxis response regulator CheY [Clostridium tetanomorphum]NRZ98770.1 two-component system chemotaxis response regulator CheY [Clostridium tetanomorphum]